ncbi:MAG: tetratricopeptide repeat protein [Bacillota bacterium]
MTVKRNDPCPCGSGKKYKQCCGPKAEVISLAAAREEREHVDLLDRLIRFAGSLPAEEGMADAVLRYFASPPPEEPTDQEYLEPLDWVLFGYRSPATGTTLCERMLQEKRKLTGPERELAQRWAGGVIPGFFEVTGVDGSGIHLRRLGDDAGPFAVVAKAELNPGDLLGAWLLPGPTGLRFGCFLTPVMPGTGPALVHLLAQELTLLRRQRPDATWDQLYREHWPRLVDCATMAGPLGKRYRQIKVAAGPQVRGGAQAHPAWEAVAERCAQVLQAAEGGPDEIAGALRLWWDAVDALQPRINRVEPWVGAVIYLLSHQVYGSDETQAQIAEMVGSTAASVGSRAREINAALAVSPSDPRYADLLDPLIRADWRIEVLAVAEQGGRPLALTRPQPPGSPREEAAELIDQAWETGGKRRLTLARQAISLWPDAADAYVILGEAALQQGDFSEAIRQFQAGVEAGERALGKRFFQENTGHFWGLVESRPYMRARRGLADALWAGGKHEAAIGHCEALLRLNPNDNQGIRWLLAAHLLLLGDNRRLEALLKAYPDDPFAFMTFTWALLAFRQKGPSKEADERLRRASERNPHVAEYLLGRRRMPAGVPEYIGLGDEREAQAYVIDFLAGWRATPGALQWLESRI